MFNRKRPDVHKTWCRKMLILLVVHLWNLHIIVSTAALGHPSIQPATFDITIGRTHRSVPCCGTPSFFFSFLQAVFSQIGTKERIRRVWKVFSNTPSSTTIVSRVASTISRSKSVFKKKPSVWSPRIPPCKPFKMVGFNCVSPSSLAFFSPFILVCALIHQRRIQGIFGPPYAELATLVQSISNHVDIPFISVCSSCYDVESLEEEISSEDEHQHKRSRMSINLYPSNHDLNMAFHNLTHQLQWTKFLVIYDTDSGSERHESSLNTLQLLA